MKKIQNKKDGADIKDLSKKIDNLNVVFELISKNMATLLNDAKYHSKEISTLKDSFTGLETNFNDLNEIVSKSFEKIDGKIDSLEKNLTSKIDGMERRIDDLALNRVKYEDFDPLKNRVLKIEHKLSLSK
jgi:predicted  nucleic acid-binding Zn-ribbon protein